MTGFIADLAQSARRLASAPGFVIATVLSIGLGIGVNTAVFTTANELLLKPMAVPRSGELVRIFRGAHSPLNGRQLREVQSARSFSEVFGETASGATLVIGSAEPERVRVSLASDNFFTGMEIVPVAGRLFSSGNGSEGPEVVLAFEFWQRRFGGDPAVVGRSVQLNGRSFTVTGVVPAGQSSAQVGWWSDLVVPIRDSRALIGVPGDSLQGSLYVTARLAKDASAAQADAELAVIASRIQQGPPAVRNFSLRTRPARGITEEVRTPATIATLFLASIAALVLIMAATNVGNLMLARNAARRRELGVRAALGATKLRLTRLLLAEATVLALLSVAAAWFLSRWAVALIPRVIPPDAEVRLAFSQDWRVFTFTGIAGALALVLFGLVPARIATRRDLSADIKEGGATGHGVDGARARRRFLMVQVALCALLLAVGSLFVRSLERASAVDVGFEPEGIVTAYMDLSGRQLSDEALSRYFDRLLSDVRQISDIQSASYSRIPELMGSNSATTVLTDAAQDTLNGRSAFFNSVGADYHRNLRIPLVSGRDFTTMDQAIGPLVLIVNETFAAREWPGQNPLGRRVSFSGAGGPWHEVVGVSRNVKYHTLGEGPKAFFTVPVAQSPSSDLFLEARLTPTARARDVMAAIVQLSRTLDPLLPPPRTQLLTELQSVSLLPAKAGAALLGGIGGLAFVLAVVGVGGVASYSVAQRRREIGVRTALGAPPMQLLRNILGDLGKTVAISAVIGLLLALAVGRLIVSQLYGLSFADPLTFIAVPGLLFLLAIAAAWIPAHRALSIAPAEAMRVDD